MEILILKNKFGIENPVELARVEEKISKQQAMTLWTSDELKNFQARTFKTLAHIRLMKFIFFAGKLRDVNISKVNFRFASALYLIDAVLSVENNAAKKFNELVEKVC